MIRQPLLDSNASSDEKIDAYLTSAKQDIQRLVDFFNEAVKLNLISPSISEKIFEIYNQVAYRCVFMKTLYVMAISSKDDRVEILERARKKVEEFGLKPVPAVPVLSTVGNIEFVTNITNDYYILDDIPEIVDLYMTLSLPPHKIATDKPRPVKNNADVCYAISVFQAIANFFPLLGHVEVDPTSPALARTFVNIMNELLAPKSEPFDIIKAYPDLKSAGDSRDFLYNLINILKSRNVATKGLNLMRLFNILIYETMVTYETINYSTNADTKSSFAEASSCKIFSIAPVYIIQVDPKRSSVEKVVHLPTFPSEAEIKKRDTFELHALVCTNGNHALSFVKRADGTWYFVDDLKVEAITEDKLPLLVAQQNDVTFLSKLPKKYSAVRPMLAFYLRTSFGEDYIKN